MVIRTVFVFFILTTSIFASCKSNEFDSKRQIENIEIRFNEDKKFISRLSKYYLASKENSTGRISDRNKKFLKKFNKRKRYKAVFNINYRNGTRCEYEADVRLHGDNIDHVEIINGTPISSLRVKLKEGNINNITRFILFRPISRNFDNEIFATTFMNHLDFLSPRTFKVKVNISNQNVVYLLQESLKKELLEFNKKIEGPILESKENNFSHLKMSRISNKEWMKKNKNKYIASLNSIIDYNLILLKAYKFQISGAQDETVRIDKENLKKTEFKKISTFDAFMYAIGAAHGLSFDDRRFYFDTIYSQLEPIYYDGDVNILSKINYHRYSGKFKKRLKKIEKIEDPYLNFFSNIERDRPTRHRNPTVNYFAKIGAENAISILKDIDSSKLLKQLKENGFEDITPELLDDLLNHINERLIKMKKAKVYEKKIDLEKSLYQKYKKEMNYNENLRLVFLNKNYVIDDNLYLNNIEVCDPELVLCEKKTIKRKEINKFLEQTNSNYIFTALDKNEYKYGKSNKSISIIDDLFYDLNINNKINISHNKQTTINVFKEQKIIEISYKNDLGRVIIHNSNLDNWTLKLKNFESKINNEFDNIHNLNGCLTIIDSKFNLLNISASDFNCEDAINFVRSEGIINNIEIENSKFDALDADFSQLIINNLYVESSGNDCSDFSYGDYNIKNAELKNCGDKAVSVGEMSNMNIGKLIVENSVTGVASKDSSITKIDKGNLSNLEICLSAYKKKQEFGGSKMMINNLVCKNYVTKLYSDSNSEIFLNN